MRIRRGRAGDGKTGAQGKRIAASASPPRNDVIGEAGCGFAGGGGGRGMGTPPTSGRRYGSGDRAGCGFAGGERGEKTGVRGKRIAASASPPRNDVIGEAGCGFAGGGGGRGMGTPPTSGRRYGSGDRAGCGFAGGERGEKTGVRGKRIAASASPPRNDVRWEAG